MYLQTEKKGISMIRDSIWKTSTREERIWVDLEVLEELEASEEWIQTTFSRCSWEVEWVAWEEECQEEVEVEGAEVAILMAFQVLVVEANKASPSDSVE